MKINRWLNVVQGASEVLIHRWDALIFSFKGLCSMRSISCRMTETNALTMLLFTCQSDGEELTLLVTCCRHFI